jgi:acetyl-CoA C-acetyltransferase
MQEVFIVAATRTAIGDFLGQLAPVQAVEFGTTVIKELVKRSGIPMADFEEVTSGMNMRGGHGGNPARQMQIAAGLPYTGYASTIDQQCSSGMRAIEMVSQQIMLGKTNIGIGMGIESMSNAAYILPGARSIRMGDVKLLDSLTTDGLVCAIYKQHMGMTAENLAVEYNISRQEQDELAYLSHQRALAAIKDGKFKDEIVPIEVPSRKGPYIFDTDEHPKDTPMEKYAAMKPAFKKEGGTVTAANASGINDGAAGVVLVSGDMLKKYGLKPMAKLVCTCSAGVEPRIMGIGPAYAIPKALKIAGLTKEDIGYYEINEAFAAQFLACNRVLQLPMDKVNLNGSGIGLGHPTGATGARIIVSLLYEARRRGDKYGCASLCVGGGPSMASIWEMCY